MCICMHSIKLILKPKKLSNVMKFLEKVILTSTCSNKLSVKTYFMERIQRN